MKMKSLRALVLSGCLALLAACVGPRSEIEVFHLRDQVRDGRVEYLSELVKALGSSDEQVRSAAIRSLADLGEVAIPRLQQTVREETHRSGPAILALGFTGDPEVLEFIRGYKSHKVLGAPAQEAEREIERRVYARVGQGELDAMEAYLEAFPESPRVQDIKATRRQKLARAAYEQVNAQPTVKDLEEYLKAYGDTEDAPAARIMLARLLVKEAQGRIELQEFAQARQILEKVPEVDPRRTPEAQRLTHQSYLLEGKAHKAAGRDDQAMLFLEKAAAFPEFRLEAERLQADMLMTQARSRLTGGNVREGIVLADRAQRLDPARRQEVASIKSELSLKFQAKIQGADPVERKLALVGLMSLGDEAVKPMELYLGNLFARKDYGSVEEVVAALSEARRETPKDLENPGVDAVGQLLTSYLKAALTASTADINRLFSSPEFLKSWNNHINPTDPREFPLIYKVEELTVRHLGLSRVALGIKALLGESGLDVVKGTLWSEDDLKSRLVQGQVGNDASLPMLNRVQLSARYATTMGEFSRSIEGRPEQFMAYAVGLTLPPLTAADWLQVADGFKETLARVKAGQPFNGITMQGGLRTARASLVALDYDQRSLTVQVYDPVVDGLGAGDPTSRADAQNRTLALLFNTSRIAFGLYAGIDRYTVLLGTTETPLTSISAVRGGRFDPETRMMLSQKSFGKLDWTRLRELNGSYGPSELTLTDLQWYRWNR